MQSLYDEVASLDRRCYEEFGLSEDLLMEHAASCMASFIRKNFSSEKRIIVACGGGNNGADGIALARLLHGAYSVQILQVKPPKSPMALLQQKRAEALGVTTITQLMSCDVLVEAIIGSGFAGELDGSLSALVAKMHASSAYKIACDFPIEGFYADVTLTMGALKKSLFLDAMKDRVGEIHVCDLGVARALYELPSRWNLLDMEDLHLPRRAKQDSHKGSYGHLACLSGTKSGASVLTAESALRFGAGLVTLIGTNLSRVPHAIMSSSEFPSNVSAVALGMGLGRVDDTMLDLLMAMDIAMVLDADILTQDAIKVLLQKYALVLTPHPKEFVALLEILELAKIDVIELQKERFRYVELFCKSYPHATLLLKGANVIIGKEDHYFINPHGSAKLAKGGSGDVLSGLIGALLAQGYTPLEAAKSGSLAHAKLACGFDGADFSLTPDDLIAQIKLL